MLQALCGVADIPSVQNYPLGFPLQAAFQSSEPSWSIYRGFNYLHARVIVELQDELRCLEKRLTVMDKLDNDNGEGERLMSRDEQGEERTELIRNIREKLVQYGRSLKTYFPYLTFKS